MSLEFHRKWKTLRILNLIFFKLATKSNPKKLKEGEVFLFFWTVTPTTQNLPSTHLCFPSEQLRDNDPVFLSPNWRKNKKLKIRTSTIWTKKLYKKHSNNKWCSHRIRKNLLGPRLWRLLQIPKFKVTKIWERVLYVS